MRRQRDSTADTAYAAMRLRAGSVISLRRDFKDIVECKEMGLAATECYAG
jgi:hypothetical protein